ncbi:MAG: DUF2380 domain-containing protein, partial [Bacteroidales bacterium]|nr:DUF2380 domain-containing protein [Bacteroidales bacterium]
NVVAPVEGWRRVPGLVEVYGIEVEYFHNYYVGIGDDAMLVHNGPACLRRPKLTTGMQRSGISETTRLRAGVVRPDRHHIFPQSRRAWFERRGVDIDRYTLQLDRGTHSALHYGGGPGRGGGFWNNEVMQRLTEREAQLGRQLSTREILQIGADMRRRAGLSHIKVIPYGAP